MLPALLAEIGLPLLARLVGGALGTIDHPAAKAAAEALKAATGSLAPEQIAEANRHIEALAAMESAFDRDALREVNSSLRAEVASEDAYVRRMRPTFGYVMAATWAAQMGAVAWTVVRAPAQAASVIESLGALSVVWSVGLSVLGVYVYRRSSEKALAAGSEDPGIAARLVRAIRGG
ncbi:MAG: ribokinase [Alphaproteobacteria bacterium]|nr:ribokinase [Alphaproteobacteria bacterium]